MAENSSPILEAKARALSQAEVRDFLEIYQHLFHGREKFFRAVSRLIAPLGLTPQQLRVLRIVAATDNLPVGGIGEQMPCTKGNITGLLDGLTRKGLITRRRDRKERRVIRVRITEAGKALIAQAPTERELADVLPVRHMTAKNRRQLLENLHRLMEEA
ncbi:MAG: MarR family winged helix-turn-helix transcriptional regulator [Planctomycetota bacterium]|jgi:DNA-binding MarR family transcriptional regulator